MPFNLSEQDDLSYEAPDHIKEKLLAKVPLQKMNSNKNITKKIKLMKGLGGKMLS